LAVVLCHIVSSHSNALQMAARREHPWLDLLAVALGYGREGVPLFFVISGFCIHLRWARENAAAQDAASGSKPSVPFLSFWQRRLHRLYPPYFVALIFALGVALVQWKTSGRPELSLPSARGMAVDFAIHVPMLHGLSAVFDEKGGNNVFWTLAREEYFYLAYFPLLWLRQRAGITRTVWAVAILGALAPLAAQVLAGGSEPAWLYAFNVRNSAVALWIQWCLGMIAVEAFCLRRELPAWCRSVPLGAAWLVAGVVAREAKVWPYFAHVLWGMACWTLLNVVVHAEQNGRWRQGPVVRWFAWVGAFSYSLYLVHRPLLILWRKAELIVLGKLGLAGLEAQAWMLPLEWTASLVVCYAAGRAFYALVERHFVPGAKKTLA
jgi:peptidoglycan/LPS O-acetylase OafA/YrhL